MAAPHGVDDADSDDEMAGAATHKAKPRRKSHQRPQVGRCARERAHARTHCMHVRQPPAAGQEAASRGCILHTLSATQGSDQIRQAFSKRKKGLVLKAYQLSALTDAKVRARRMQQAAVTASSDWWQQ